jgi:hypothetical protein
MTISDSSFECYRILQKWELAGVDWDLGRIREGLH